MTKYEQFDKVLLEQIAAGNVTAGALDHSHSPLRKAVPAVSLGKPFFRVIDARLQALRKAGKIIYQDRRWSIVK